MPQLSPLSWIFIFLFLGVMVFMVTVLIWWIEKSELSLDVSDMNCCNVQNKWGMMKNACQYFFYFWWS